ADHDVGGRGRRALRFAAGGPCCLGIPVRDARVGEAAADRVLDALGPPAERREASAVTGGAGVGQGGRGGAEPADEPGGGGGGGERDRALVATDHGSALVAGGGRRKPD